MPISDKFSGSIWSSFEEVTLLEMDGYEVILTNSDCGGVLVVAVLWGPSDMWWLLGLWQERTLGICDLLAWKQAEQRRYIGDKRFNRSEEAITNFRDFTRHHGRHRPCISVYGGLFDIWFLTSRPLLRLEVLQDIWGPWPRGSETEKDAEIGDNQGKQGKGGDITEIGSRDGDYSSDKNNGCSLICNFTWIEKLRKDEKLICAEICVRRRPICARDRNELKFCARRNISADFPFHTFKLPSQLDKDLSTVFHWCW